MAKTSAALLVYRFDEAGVLKVLIAHMGGPFWAKKDARAWSIPKGEYQDGEEDPLAAASREFEEEMGRPAPRGEVIDLGICRQPSGKLITTFAVQGEFDLSEFRSNTFEMEWPKGSGKVQSFPEVDRAEWLTLGVAREKLVKGQVAILDSLRERLVSRGTSLDEESQSTLF